MHGDVLNQTELALVDADLASNQADIDFVEAVLARGSDDAVGLRERLASLDDARGRLLDHRDQLTGQAEPS